jgi:hypothetical protein
MPTITATQLGRLNRLIKEAAIYINCTKPADGADVALTAGVPAGGTWVGLTQDAAEWDYTPTISGIKIEQTNLEVAPRITDEQVQLTFKTVEAVSDKLALAIGPGGTLTNTAGATTTPSKNTIAMGGKSDVTTQTVVLVSQIGTYTYMGTPVTLYEWFVIYNAVSATGAKVSFKRNETRMVQVTIKGYGDPTRTVGDQASKYGAMYDPSGSE